MEVVNGTAVWHAGYRFCWDSCTSKWRESDLDVVEQILLRVLHKKLVVAKLHGPRVLIWGV